MDAQFHSLKKRQLPLKQSLRIIVSQQMAQIDESHSDQTTQPSQSPPVLSIGCNNHYEEEENAAIPLWLEDAQNAGFAYILAPLV